MKTPTLHLRRRLLELPVFALASTAIVFAQQPAAPAPDPRTLAKYDSNKNGRLDPDEVAAMQSDQAKAAGAVAPADTASAAKPDDTVRLSPFEVKEDSKGYYATTTMSGTRLNTRLEDLASAISVVTKQQMQDFAMLDINDIFNYETSTEGTGNYTDYSVDRNGMVTDNIQNNPQGANRVRGGSAANIALNNFATSGRVPLDPINIEAVEISRGPNSNIFGLGQGSGTVNLVGASASLSRASSTVEFRADDIGGYRGSIDINRPIYRDKLAVRVSSVYQHDAYRQKPSGATTHRYNIMVRAQPFKNTTVRASYQLYDFFGTRPNTITPRDAVSYWKNTIGQPVWDPLTTTVTVNGVATNTGTVNPTGLTTLTLAGRSALFIDQSGLSLWEIQQMPAATATNGPLNTGGAQRLLVTQPDPVRTGHPLYSTVRGISSRDIYDYSSINLAGINSIDDHNETTTVELEQVVLNTPMHKLAVQLGWNREDAERINKNFIGQSSAGGNSNYLYVDVNKNLLDGRPNPWYLRPYMGVGEPIHSSQPYLRDSFRGQLAYTLDFTSKEKWMHWLGRHQVVGYAEERLTKSYQYRFRDVNITDNPIYAPAGSPKANQSGVVGPAILRGMFDYYVGDSNGQNIDYAPTAFKYGTYTFNWYNPQTAKWVADSAQLAEAAIQEGSAGNFASQNLINTRGAVLQSSFLDDRMVATFGKRHDDNNNKFQRPPVLKANGYEFDYAAMDGWVGNWAKASGDTTTKGVVLKPFRGWHSLDSRVGSGGAGGFIADLLTGMTVHYNKSDSFLPEVPAISVTLENLPNPTSNGKDYGFSVSLWDNKFVLRANRYENASINTRNGQFGTFGQRTLRLDMENYAGNNDNFSLQKQARLWVAAANPGFSAAQVDDAVLKVMGLSAAQVTAFNTNTISETQDQTAKGDEIELNYNPDRFWTVKLNVTRQESIDANVAPHIPAWVAQRMAIWTSVIDPRTNTPWFTQLYSSTGPVATGGNAANTFLQGNVVSPIALAQATQGKSRPEIREWRYNLLTSLRLAKYSEQRFLKNVTVGGGLRWESKGAIGYYGIPINGDITVATAYDPNRPVYDKAHTYVDAFVTYNMRLFNDKVRARFQLNGRNLQESKAHLEPVGAYPDGSAHTFRIIDPRNFVFTASFDL
ncbi:MAG TPA: TonB-dependent receptor plug domain-containing protein [Opitutaceae bacterium]|nr:TonB-dependent receptor plug domain-containing protein [Opitutaceae bacterium]